MPHRDDFEDFDKSNEGLVSQIGVKSVDDDDVDIALKLTLVDMYERRLREVMLFKIECFFNMSLISRQYTQKMQQTQVSTTEFKIEIFRKIKI